jgi:hypothetical protein
MPNVTQQDAGRANAFLQAIKSGTLDEYFEPFTDAK